MPSLRRRWNADIRKGFHALRVRVRHLVVGLDVFGLRSDHPIASPYYSAHNFGAGDSFITNEWHQAWVGETSDGKVKRFRAWLRQQIDSTLPGNALIEKYIQLGHSHGIDRAIRDARKTPAYVAASEEERMAYLKGVRDDVAARLKSRQVTVEQVKLLAGRTFTEMEDVNTRMATAMNRILVDGLVKHSSPTEIATELAEQLDMSQNRALRIARTELTRAHAEGQLDGLEYLGVGKVTAEVEWVTDGGSAVCPLCADMAGETFTVEEARGMIPLHPHCACAWLPAGES